LRIPNYRRYFIGNALGMLGMQMASVAIGWELYARTNSLVALGLVGLAQVLPIITLALLTGHIIDRVNRKALILSVSVLLILSSSLMAFSSYHSTAHAQFTWILPLNNALASIAHLFGETNSHFDDPHVPIMFVLLLINGVVRSFNQPAKQSLMPMLVPPRHFSNAVTWNSSMFEVTNVAGPLLSGTVMTLFLLNDKGSPWTYASIYAFNALAQFIQWINFSTITLTHVPRPKQPVSIKSLLAGVRFVYKDKIILGTISLDMFAVLLGGATALLPAFAEDILHVGPLGLGMLRAAPSVGAVLMALILAHSPPMKHAGRNMLLAVVGFGVATIIFGLSTYFWLSLIALFFTGIFDNISVVVRHTLVQLRTPDFMRGRVNAVNSVFISSSNELGAFESGTTAAIGKFFLGAVLGPMVAVAAGGVGTILVVGGIATIWPQLLRVGKLSALDETVIKEEEKSEI